MKCPIVKKPKRIPIPWNVAKHFVFLSSFPIVDPVYANPFNAPITTPATNHASKRFAQSTASGPGANYVAVFGNSVEI